MDVLSAKLKLLKGNDAQLPLIIKDFVSIGMKYLDPLNNDEDGNLPVKLQKGKIVMLYTYLYIFKVTVYFFINLYYIYLNYI
jgi:hypothetical protein